jgi:hypothetical protein
MTKEEKNAKERERYQRNREKRLAQTKAYAQSHPEVRAKATRNWRERHRDQYNAYMRNYLATHKEVRERLRSSQRAYHEQWYIENREYKKAKNREWYRNNKAKNYSYLAARRALEIMAMPPWVKREDIAAIYIEARRKSITLGVPFEVDHIWPLRGRGFNGLHVPWNLRIIPKLDNRKKFNKRPIGGS